MTNHIRDFQVLDRDQIGALDERGRLLMQPSVARVRDLAVQSGNPRTHLIAAITTALATGKRALPPTQFFLGSQCNAWIRDYHVITTIGEYLQAEINADGRCNRALLGRSHGNLQAHVPAATVTTEYARANIGVIGQRAM